MTGCLVSLAVLDVDALRTVAITICGHAWPPDRRGCTFAAAARPGPHERMIGVRRQGSVV
jgi:hypothetical protein